MANGNISEEERLLLQHSHQAPHKLKIFNLIKKVALAFAFSTANGYFIALDNKELQNITSTNGNHICTIFHHNGLESLDE